MKKQYLILAVMIMTAISTLAGPNPRRCSGQLIPQFIDHDMTLTNDTTWILDGRCYVINNAKLTIDEGTRIEAVKEINVDRASTLIITRGCQIDAQGSSTNPIIFTSHEATPATGDWGGIVLFGRAPVNEFEPFINGISLPSAPTGVDIKYGGNDPLDNSGVLRFVRIEYPGAQVGFETELSGLTCGGVGSATLLDFIEVALGGDNAFKFSGGTVDAKHLIAYSPHDDAFNFDLGYKGRIQFAVSVRRPAEVFFDGNGIESENDGLASNDIPRTEAIISNMTVLGLATEMEVVVEGLLDAARLRRNCSYIIRNSVFAGYSRGVHFESGGSPGSPSFIGNFQYNTVHAYSNLWPGGIAPDATNTSHLGGDANNEIDLEDPFDRVTVDGIPVFRPNPTSPLLTAPTSFAGLPNSDNFFDTNATYRGAFALTGFASNWDLGGWAKYNY